jgi:hypothetical protein
VLANFENNVTTFNEIDQSSAIIEIKLSSIQSVVGVSASLDVLPLCEFGTGESENVKLETVAIVEEGTAEGFDEEAERTTTTEGGNLAADGDEPTDADAAAPVEAKVLLTPVCHVKLRFVYAPNNTEIKDKAVEELNEIGQEKQAIIQRIRKVAEELQLEEAAALRAAAATEQQGGGGNQQVSSKGEGGGAVKGGFLNKDKASTAPSSVNDAQPKVSLMSSLKTKIAKPLNFALQWGPIMKNYALFAGVVAYMHFRGDDLALPAIV